MSTYAQRVQLGPFFSSGVLQGGAKLYHYAAGSSTLKNIWLDRDQLTTLAQPFVADSDGVFNFFADGLYKLIVVGPDSTGPTDDVLYTLDNWQLLDPAADITWSEEAAVASASSIALGPGIWQHVTGSTTIATMTMTGPFAWLVFDGNLTLTYSANLLTPAGIDLAVRQNDVLFVLNEGSGVVRISNHYQYDGLLIATQDSRTSSSDVGLTVRSTTSGTPAAGIGTDILLQAESADETPSDVVQVGGAFSDVSAGSEDSYWRVLLRVAGAALTECWRFASAAAFKGILTHTNTADRTYTFPNASYVLDAGECYKGPTSCGTGSTRSHEGTVTVASNGNYSGVHFYTDFTLNSGVTMTIPAGSGRLVIIASGTITINGTITGAGGGLLAGGTGGTTNGSSGNGGTDQAAGAGGGNAGAGYSGGNGGSALSHGVTVQSGGGGSTGAGGAGTQLSGSSALLHDYAGLFGGASGGGGSGDGASSGGSGGRGGASIILLAPTIVLAVTGALVTSGSSGANAPSSTQAAGGGGAAGNIIIITRSYTDNGCTFTMTGGSGGTGNTANAAAGGAGAAGVKQINIFV